MIPCNSCILIPICRHKKYDSLFIDCDILFDRLYIERVLDMNYREEDFKESIKAVRETLNPSRWELEYFTARSDVVIVRGVEDE